ncbi:MAG: uroporphyrinogen-III C-methyltransferase [Actinomycetales bacterium]|nr:uroporphyrinogen-III C-methyltransferase [Actinomycetales bacterium]
MTVYLVGAGPGALDLLTVRALRLIERADVVVHDRLVGEDILALVPATAAVYDVGKVPGGPDNQDAINELLVRHGRTGRVVVRLKGGDPFVFGRGGEELAVLGAAGVACEVVPGITSAFAAPLCAGIPVTHRGAACGVVVVSARGCARDPELSRLVAAGLTLVILMGVARRAAIARELIEGGLDPSTPVAVVERASTPEQRVSRATIDELGALRVESPAIIVIGEVAALDLVGGGLEP